MAKEVKRSSDKVIAGIVGGLADYFEIDHTIARIGFALLSFSSGVVSGIVAFIICLLLMKD
ncbi:MAG: PspC domain-containing protein [Paludibacteraceae bacterium]|nr:PspC domain-containing protein [Paludibacteraceae bacterium]